MAHEVPLVTEVHQDRLVCLVLRVRRDQLVLMVQPAPLVPPVLMVHQETEEFPDCRDQQVLSAPEDLPDLKEREETLDLLGRRDRLDLLVPRDPQVPLVLEVREERRDHLASLELLV